MSYFVSKMLGSRYSALSESTGPVCVLSTIQPRSGWCAVLPLKAAQSPYCWQQRNARNLALTLADSGTAFCTIGISAALSLVFCWKAVLSYVFSHWRWHIIGAPSALLVQSSTLCPFHSSALLPRPLSFVLYWKKVFVLPQIWDQRNGLSLFSLLKTLSLKVH